ncbi:MAG: arsenic efflux protein [Patescibacteria group bacterium]|nr:arsenic efflux protein [Patescibacteria group bacterium]
MTNIIKDALIDTLRMVPLLLIIYAAIELIEYKYSAKLKEKVEKAGSAGPAIGSLVGAFPQCGFSVISSALYTQKLLTIGTLLAVYISTSDEAIPVILSQPEKAKIILPLILTKIGLALFAGYSVDLLYRKSNKKVLNHIDKFDHHECHHEHKIDEAACCGHELGEKLNAKDIIIHPLIHTAKIFVFIFATTLVINYVFFRIGDDNIPRLFLGHSIFQPVMAAFIGLIPNCAASVAITEMYLKGAISFGSTIAGLSAGAGLGLLVLFRENKNLKNTFIVLGLLLFFSITAGILIQYFYG